MITDNSFKTNCNKHGETDSYLNGSCIACAEEQEQQIKNTMRLKEIMKRKDNANIPSKFLNTSFESFICADSEMIKNKQIMEHWDFKGNLFLFGKTGNGKTHLAIATLIKFLENSSSGYYTKFYKLPSIHIQEKELYKRLLSTELLVLDEFGSSVTDYKSQLLFELIDERYDNELSTIFITNRTTEEIKSFVTDATLSRIKECCNLLFFNSLDHRVENKVVIDNRVDVRMLAAGDN